VADAEQRSAGACLRGGAGEQRRGVELERRLQEECGHEVERLLRRPFAQVGALAR